MVIAGGGTFGGFGPPAPVGEVVSSCKQPTGAGPFLASPANHLDSIPYLIAWGVRSSVAAADLGAATPKSVGS